MRLIFLGTSSGSPTPTRNVSSLALQFDDSRIWLFDCGEGTQREFSKYEAIISPGMIDVIFITHLHGDHVYGLFGMLCSLALFNRASPLDVVGPVGLKDLINAVGLHTDMKISYPLNIFELNSDTSTTLFPQKPTVLYNVPKRQLPVVAYPLPHVIRSYAFFITSPQSRYVFSESKAQALGVPYGLWNFLQSQQDVSFPGAMPSPTPVQVLALPSSTSSSIHTSSSSPNTSPTLPHTSPPSSSPSTPGSLSAKGSVLSATSVAFVPKGKIGLNSAAATSSSSAAPVSSQPPLIGIAPLGLGVNQSQTPMQLQTIKVRWKDTWEWIPHRLLICGDCGPGYSDYVPNVSGNRDEGGGGGGSGSGNGEKDEGNVNGNGGGGEGSGAGGSGDRDKKTTDGSNPSSSSSAPSSSSPSSSSSSSSSSSTSSSASILRSPQEGVGVGLPTDWNQLFSGVQEVDTLVHESTYATHDKWRAEKWGHSTAGEAGEHAKLLNAKTLILNHFSKRYFSQDERGIFELVRDAQQTCPKTAVYAAYDGFIFEL